MNKHVITTILTLLFAITCYAVLPDSLTNKGNYKKLRYRDNNGKTFILHDAYIGDGAIVADTTVVEFDQITKLEYRAVSTGEKIRNVTTTIGLLAGIVASVAIFPPDKYEEDDEVSAMQLVPVIAFGLVGYAIGSPFHSIGKRYKTLYDEKKHAGLNNLQFNFAMGDPSKKAIKYVGISYKF